jgi:aspartate kinase
LSDAVRKSDGPIVVRKYGGSSLADIPRLRAVACDLRRAHDEGLRLVIVVSAMGDQTDQLAALARQVHPEPPRRELDMLLSVGERMSMALLCMALAAEGVPAMSLTGSQAGIITDTSHTDARILAVRPIRVPEALAAGQVVVVAGFQGVSEQTKEITTLGRGGSDTSAVALAHALGAERCEILKDVPGVMTADPGQVPDARCLRELSYEDMQRIADAGCGVVHPRAVDYARRHAVKLVVGSSFTGRIGTEIGTAVAPAPPSLGAYQPRVLIVAERQARLMLGSPGPVPHPDLPGLACRATAAGPLTGEWLAAGDRWFWEGWGAAANLDPVALSAAELADAEPDEVLCHWEDELAVVTLAGRRPENWCGALMAIGEVLRAHDCAEVPLRTDGDAVRILVPESALPQLPQALHAAFLAD